MLEGAAGAALRFNQIPLVVMWFYCNAERKVSAILDGKKIAFSQAALKTDFAECSSGQLVLKTRLLK